MNTEEQQAVTDSTLDNGVVMAGPGTGKTRTLAARVERLLATTDDSIAVITYTVAAANELRSRLGLRYRGFCGTLHSYCIKLLQEHGEEYGLPSKFGVLDQAAAYELIQRAAHEVNYSQSLTGLLRIVSKAWCRTPTPPYRTREDRFVSGYRALQMNIGMLDFDTILHYGVQLARVMTQESAPDMLYVDEAQDMAAPDLEFYRCLRSKQKWFFGDPDQSIFGFRGNAVDAMSELAKHNPVFMLTHNHRSDSSICDAANNLCRWVMSRPVRKRAGMFHVEHFHTPEEEEAAVANFLSVKDGTKAVLCRTNAIAEAYCLSLGERGIACVTRKPPVMPPDWQLGLRVLGLMVYPTESGAAYLLQSRGHSREVQEAFANRTSLLEILGLVDSVNNWQDGLDALLRFNISADTIGLLRGIADTMPHGSSLTDLIAEARLHGSKFEVNEAEGAAYIGTVHSAKGREWDHVALPNWVEGSLPHGRSLSPSEVAEEERVAYVGVTRAKHSVLVTSCAANGEQSRFARQIVEGRTCK